MKARSGTEKSEMVGKSKTVILTGILALAALGTGAALASGGEVELPTRPTVAVTEKGPEAELEATEVENTDDVASEDNEVEEAGEAEEGPQADDSSEDVAEGSDVAITGTDLGRASAAALDYLGEGRVTATEVGDEESYYEVEVTLDDGSQVDVQLDESFNVVGTD